MILAVIQASMRTPGFLGRAMMPLARQPMIVRQIERVARARRIDRLVVALSHETEDDAIAQAVRREGITAHRGALEEALEAFPAQHLVRLSADSPLADPEIIDATIARHLASGAARTRTPSDCPLGLEVEVLAVEAARHAALPPPSQAIAPETAPIRWVVERPDDYAFAAAVYDALYPANCAFTSSDILALMAERPDLARFGGARRQ